MKLWKAAVLGDLMTPSLWIQFNRGHVNTNSWLSKEIGLVTQLTLTHVPLRVFFY